MTPRTEVIWAVNCERARCCKIIEGLLAELPPGDAAREMLAERLERMRFPWRVRAEAKRRARPERERYCCTICDKNNHNRRRCPDRKKAAA